MNNTVLVTGGGGYVGTALVPRLLAEGYKVKVLDLFWFGNFLPSNKNLEIIKGDIRDTNILQKAVSGCDQVIHLACISNDPSFELDPSLGKSINYDAFMPLVEIAVESNVKRFIYASSSSVYGVKEEKNVTEELVLEPLTDYSKYKALCEYELSQVNIPGFTTLIVRPATVCGYSPRMRLDLTVNLLTNHAYNNRLIRVFGGNQLRPNIHIEDMVDFYLKSLVWPDHLINGKTYNVGYENHSVGDIAKMVQEAIGDDVNICVEATDDHRSYHISSQKIADELGFVPNHNIKDAINDILEAFKGGDIPNSMTDNRYYNVKVVKETMVGAYAV